MEFKGYVRQQLKRTDIAGLAPTPYTGSDWTTDTNILTTDLLDGELFLNTYDQRIWVCMSSSIYELPYSGSVPSFVTLPDVPNSYLGSANYLLRVNSGETAVEFVSGSAVTVATSSYTVSSSYSSNSGHSQTSTTAYTASSTDNVQMNNNSYINGDMYLTGLYNLYFNSGSLYVDNIYGFSPVGINNNLYVDTTSAYLSSSLTLHSSSVSQSGDIRWTGVDFEGYEGSQWLSLTGQLSGSYVTTTTFTNFSASVASQLVTSNTFLGLTDTPSTYIGNGDRILRVNTAEDAVEFVVPQFTSGSGLESIVQVNTLHPNTATGKYSIALGGYCTASGDYSYTQGQECYAMDDSAHATGFRCIASGSYAHAEGWFSVAHGGTHAEGDNCYAKYRGAHAEGNATTALNFGAHSEGGLTTANGQWSHAEGGYTTASGESAHAEGINTLADNDAAHAEGINTVANGQYSHAEGYNTLASGVSSHVQGYSCTGSGDYSDATGHGTVASGMYSYTRGLSTIASGLASSATGYASKATATGSYADGEGANAYLKGMHSEKGDNSIPGQYGRLTIGCHTSDDVKSVLVIDYAPTLIKLNSGVAYRFTVYGIGIDGATADVASYTITGTIKKIPFTNVVTLCGTPTVVEEVDEIGCIGMNAEADNTNKSLNIVTTGKIGTEIDWSAIVQWVEVG